MYNPSNHIPLSKSLGPNAFPIDGKYMYFTNGANNVYRYRPFQSTAEAIAYFPLGSSFRGSPEGQPWAFEVLINEGGTLSVDGGYITGGINSVWWWRDGVSDADLIKKNGPTTGDIKQFRFTRADLTNVVDGNGDLILPFTGSQIALGLISRSEQDDNEIPTGELVANLAGGPVTSYNQLPDVDQFGIVYYVGEAGEAPIIYPKFYLRESTGSTQDTTFRYNNGADEIMPAGDSFTGSFEVGDTISFDLSVSQYITFNILDLASGTTSYTNNTNGPATFNGPSMQYGKAYQYLIFDTEL